ncbi:unnamed protein product, partial [Oppiella nova]
SQIRWTLSRNDLISISRGSDNTTLKIRSLKEGRTLVRIFDSENNNYDYFNVDVGPVIEPHDLAISVGQVVCLNCKLKSAKTGFWFVENPSIGDIDRNSGVFVARSGGHTSIGWKSTDGLSTYTPINVMPPQEFSLDTTHLVGITNIIIQSIPISIVSQTFDINTNQWFCRFEPKSDLNLAEMAAINTNVSISVIMSAATRDSEANLKPLIHTISIPFVPAFDVSPKQVILSLDQSETRLTIHSVPLVLEDLTIVTSNPEVIDYFQPKVSVSATTTVPSNIGSPFLADIHSPLKGHRIQPIHHIKLLRLLHHALDVLYIQFIIHEFLGLDVDSLLKNNRKI